MVLTMSSTPMPGWQDAAWLQHFCIRLYLTGKCIPCGQRSGHLVARLDGPRGHDLRAPLYILLASAACGM